MKAFLSTLFITISGVLLFYVYTKGEFYSLEFFASIVSVVLAMIVETS